MVTLSEEYFPQFSVGDTVNLAALSKAVNVSHEFLAGYAFEHGLGQPVSEIQAAAAIEGEQLVAQAGPPAARKDTVLCERRWVPRVFVMACPVSLFLRSSCYRPVFMLAIMGSALMLDCLLRLLVFFLFEQFVSIRGLKGVVLWTFQGICGAIRCWPTRNQCFECGQPRSASS